MWAWISVSPSLASSSEVSRGCCESRRRVGNPLPQGQPRTEAWYVKVPFTVSDGAEDQGTVRVTDGWGSWGKTNLINLGKLMVKIGKPLRWEEWARQTLWEWGHWTACGPSEAQGQEFVQSHAASWFLQWESPGLRLTFDYSKNDMQSAFYVNYLNLNPKTTPLT